MIPTSQRDSTDGGGNQVAAGNATGGCGGGAADAAAIAISAVNDGWAGRRRSGASE